MHTAGFCHITPDGVIQCDLCRHYCRIPSGRTGLCRVRKNINGTLVALTWGRAVAQGADPVEKKPLYHFMPASLTWSFSAPGCNFTCVNCQNWQISQSLPGDETIPFTTPEEIVTNALEAGCSSISCTWTEPTVYAEYAIDVMKLSKEAGLRNIWVSNGYLSKNCLDAIRPWLDAINVDLKSMDDAFYRRMCGARVAPVLDSLRQISSSGIHLEITTLIIPGHSDEPAMLERLADFIVHDIGKETPWHLTPFYPDSSWKMKDLQATASESLEIAGTIGIRAGLSHVYAGESRNNTCCSHCGTTLVRRERSFRGFEVERFDKDGQCPVCLASSPLIF